MIIFLVWLLACDSSSFQLRRQPHVHVTRILSLSCVPRGPNWGLQPIHIHEFHSHPPAPPPLHVRADSPARN